MNFSTLIALFIVIVFRASLLIIAELSFGAAAYRVGKVASRGVSWTNSRIDWTNHFGTANFQPTWAWLIG